MKRNHNNTNQNQKEFLKAADSASEANVEEVVEPMSEGIVEMQENNEAQQFSGHSETKKALLGELRAVLENTKQEAAKGGDQAAETEAKDIRQAVAAASRVEEQEREAIPAQKEKPLVSLTYESVAEAAEMARKESTGRFSRDAVDDETFLAELYTLIGDGEKPKTVKETGAAAAPSRKPSMPITPRPAGRITPEKLQAASEEYEDVLEDDEVGVPGWLKGAFLLLIALLLSAMTFYAVATDVIGKIF